MGANRFSLSYIHKLEGYNMSENTVVVKKANRILSVSQSRLKGYLSQGYDQIDNNGEIVTHATGGKVIRIGDYNKLVAENKQLKEQLASPSSHVEELQLLDEIAQLKKENATLKGELTKARKTTVGK
ncbi:hypothetical protein BpsS140_00022 [Bacillus phage vB_BpsS-140]|nr:hypothetical protein BpsS140_00022 [Bacillus phage vB_BpsS-140]